AAPAPLPQSPPVLELLSYQVTSKSERRPVRWQGARRPQLQRIKTRIQFSLDTPRSKMASGSARIPSHGEDSRRCTKDNSEVAARGPRPATAWRRPAEAS